MYQDNLESKDRVCIVIEAVDKDKAIEALNDKAIPFNGVYESPIEIIAHEKLDELIPDEEDERRDDIFQEICEELSSHIKDEEYWCSNIWSSMIEE